MNPQPTLIEEDQGSARELRSGVSSPIVDGDLPDLDALEKVALAATDSRWQNGIEDLEGIVAPDEPGLGNVICVPPPKNAYRSLEHWPANASHIAAFDPPTALALIASNRALTARVEALEAALRWSVPLAEIAMETHRIERVRCGHSDIQGTYKNGVTWVGIYQSEVDDLEAARAALQGVG